MALIFLLKNIRASKQNESKTIRKIINANLL